MSDRLLDDPQYWRDQAKEARMRAEQTLDPDHKHMMLRIAEGHERQSALLELSRTAPLLSSGVGAMYRSVLLERLAQARHHVTTGERHVARQRESVAALKTKPQDLSSAEHFSNAKQLLALFEELQRLHIIDRDRLEKELAEIAD
jgi:hypothetical protein